MTFTKFTIEQLKTLWKPQNNSSKFDSGQVTVIGGSSLFHGAPLFSLKAASRLVDMVYFSGVESDKGVADQLKASLGNFIWVPRSDVEYYLSKSSAVLIGPGLMRYSAQSHNGDMSCDDEGRVTRDLTITLLQKYPDQRWVIDGGSLQVIKAEEIPQGAIVTPNNREFEMLFGISLDFGNIDETVKIVSTKASQYQIIIAAKGPVSVVSNGEHTFLVDGGNAGLTKGGTGDLMAGLTVGFRAKNEGLLSAAAANFLVKKAAEELEQTRGLMFNTDDVADMVPQVWKKFTR